MSTTQDTNVKNNNRVSVMVCTEYKGVFFGFIDEADEFNREVVKVYECQMALYFTASIGGVLGLCATGPDEKCRVSKPVPSFVLQKISAIARTTPEAVKAWKKCPWG